MTKEHIDFDKNTAKKKSIAKRLSDSKKKTDEHLSDTLHVKKYNENNLLLDMFAILEKDSPKHLANHFLNAMNLAFIYEDSERADKNYAAIVTFFSKLPDMKLSESKKDFVVFTTKSGNKIKINHVQGAQSLFLYGSFTHSAIKKAKDVYDRLFVSRLSYDVHQENKQDEYMKQYEKEMKGYK